MSFCEEHGKKNCPKYHDERGGEMCSRCEEEGVYAEGLCYICNYYQ